MKKALFIVFIGITTFGFGQSKRAINKQLKAQYQLLDIKVDSLANVYAFEKTKEKQMMDSLNVRMKTSYEKESVFNELTNAVSQKLSDLKRLGINSVNGVDHSHLDSVISSADRSVSTVIAPLHKTLHTAFFGFSKNEVPALDSYSKNDQNTMLLLLIQQRIKESDMLAEHIQESIRFQSKIPYANDDLVALDAFRDSITPYFEEVQVKLNKELSNQRLAYMKNGPTGFPLSYHRVFPDVFPETGPEIDFNNQLLTNGPVPVPEEVFTVVDEEARFPGENSALMDYTRKNLKFPAEAKKLGLEGKCYVKFVVFSSGDIGNVTILKGMPDCESCDKEAIRFIESMPTWIPAKVNGRLVNSYVILPLVFQLN